MAYLINGKFLERRITGVERFAREIIVELDRITESGRVYLAISKNAADLPELKNINIIRVGRHRGNLWEQLDLPIYAVKSGHTLLNLCNAAPLLKPDITCIHDIQPRVNPHFFSKKYVAWAVLNLKNVSKRAKAVITVSEFSKAEFRKYFHPRMPVYVIPNSWEHENRVKIDESVFDKFSLLKDKEFYFAMSSMAPNKNIKWIMETARLNPDKYFVVSGNVNRKVFGELDSIHNVENFIFTGYLSDGEAKALMSKCQAFLFPTFYEGFGIPPMEAIACGTNAVVSDGSCMREIYGNAVAYINPNVPCPSIESVVFPDKERVQELLAKYSWKESAKKLQKILDKYERVERLDKGKDE